jgi:enoyl-CoA hydratase/carnithine racemase
VVNRVVPADALAEKSLRFAHQLASRPTRAYAACKRLVRTHLEHGLRAADALLADVSPPLFATEDMRNGIVSLLEKGPGHAIFLGK